MKKRSQGFPPIVSSSHLNAGSAALPARRPSVSAASGRTAARPPVEDEQEEEEEEEEEEEGRCRWPPAGSVVIF
jgi:ribosomal protein L12E/L44/L45/RPP1/RPP2